MKSMLCVQCGHSLPCACRRCADLADMEWSDLLEEAQRERATERARAERAEAALRRIAEVWDGARCGRCGGPLAKCDLDENCSGAIARAALRDNGGNGGR